MYILTKELFSRRFQNRICLTMASIAETDKLVYILAIMLSLIADILL